MYFVIFVRPGSEGESVRNPDLTHSRNKALHGTSTDTVNSTSLDSSMAVEQENTK